MGIPAAPSQTPPAGDQANAVVQGKFTVAGFNAAPNGLYVSGSFLVWGPFNVVIYGDNPPNGAWVGTVRLERSFDGGVTWIVCNIGGGGQQASYNQGLDVSFVAGEPEKGMLYRLNATNVATDINYRMSATGQAALSMAVSSAV